MRRLNFAILGALVLTAAIVVAVPVTASAEPGDLDGTFGGCGLAGTGRGSDFNTRSPSDSVITQSSGRILHVAALGTGLVVTALQSDGQVDQSYGTNGARSTGLSNSYTLYPVRSAYAGVNDRLYIIGHSFGGPLTIQALNRQGQPDPTFSDDGQLTLAPATQLASATVQSDGRLVAAYFTPQVKLVRFGLDGTTDPSFVAHPATFLGAPIFMTSSANQVYVVLGDSNSNSGVIRLTGDGSVDLSFVWDPAVPDVNAYDYRIVDLAVDTDGTIVAAERSLPDGASGSTARSYVVRHLPSGALDPFVGNNGWRRIGTRSQSIVTDVKLETDGTMVLAGATGISVGSFTQVFTSHRNYDGSSIAGSPEVRIGFVVNPGQRLNVRGLSATDGTSTLIGTGESGIVWAAGVLKLNAAPLRRGAGLVLQWDGTAWPTRWGTDPGPECPFDSPYWPDDDNARGITTVANQGGYEVDLFGGIHPFSIGRQHARPAPATGSPYWPGWDIVRGIAAKADGTGGYTLDAYGATHPFHTGPNPQPPATTGSPYWPGQNITRGIALMPGGNRGYIVDLHGGIHRFTTAGHRLPPRVVGNPYWPTMDIARGISILDDGTGGYTVDGYGGIHPFAIGNHTPPPPPTPGQAVPYLPGVDWVRGYAFIPPKVAPVASASTTVRGPGHTNALDALLTTSHRTPGRAPR